jgi:tetratricopeptide (TPR) repeat protein
LARVYQDQGRKADADGVWQKVEQLDSHDPDLIARKSQVAAPHRGSPAPAAATKAVPASSPTRIISTAPTAALTKDNLAKLLTETDVYLKYGLHDKALEHLRKVFNVDPENIDAHEKAYAIYVASNNRVQAGEQLLNVLRLHTRGSDPARAQPFLDAILEQNPNHPEVAVFLATLRPASGSGAHESDLPEDAILVDSSGDEVLVPDESTVLPHLTGYDVALHVSDHQEGEELVEDESMAMSNYEGEPEPVIEEPVEEEILEHDEAFGEPIIEEPSEEGLALGDGYEQTSEMPAYAEELAAADSDITSESLVSEPEFAEPEEIVEEEAVEAPSEEEIPAQEECDEAHFFMEQRLFDEAQEILETVLIAFPGHARATELMGQLEAQRDGGSAPVPEESYGGSAEASASEDGYDGGSRDAFDLAAELASELGDEALSPELPSGEVPAADYQVSVDEVFSEFKKGLEKVVKPEDVDTHYDLGIAYKEMGLIDDAIGEFEVARKGAAGNRKEVDCLSMAATLYLMKGEFSAAVDALKAALQSPHSNGDIEKAVRFELGAAYEQANELGKALHQFMRVNDLDPSYRDVASMVERLSAVASPEEDEVQPPPRSSSSRPRASASAGVRGR